VREFDLKIPTHAIAPAGSRIFEVQLSSPQGARLSTSVAPCTIVSSGSASSTVPTLQITNPVPVVEPASGSTSVPVTVTLNAPAAQTTPTDVHIHWQTADGTATQPADYMTGGGDLTWPAGTYGPQTLSVQVNSNQARSAQGTFTIAFTSPDSSAGFVGAPSATVTVLPVGSTASVLSIADASAPEKQGSIPVVVTLTPTGAAPVTVDYATADGSGAKGALAGTDYTAKSGTLTFSPGQSTQTISIPITPYSLVEPNKSFQVVLSNPVGATLANSTATVTILNDNVRPVPPPINTGGGTKPQPKPIQVPTKRPNTDHAVLVQMLTGESRANAKGQATYSISCPDVVIQLCAGTVTFDVRV
jgi:chitinase